MLKVLIIVLQYRTVLDSIFFHHRELLIVLLMLILMLTQYVFQFLCYQ